MQKQFPYIPFSMAAPALSIHAVPQPPRNRAVNELSLAEPGPATITSLQRFASLDHEVKPGLVSLVCRGGRAVHLWK